MRISSGHSIITNARLTLVIVMLLVFSAARAQREYGVCDSTFYTLNTDTTVVAGKRVIYLETTSGLTPLANFTSLDTNEYIRDFDIVRPDLWYTLVGKRYISSPTVLYKSTDRGQTWVQDTSFYQATIYDPPNIDNIYYNSINQVQKMGEDTIVLFVGYYHSGIVYSVDGGNTWQEWFRNMIVHYQGILECDNYYFLYAIAGDGFQPAMFAFPKQLLFSSNSNGEWINSGLTTYHPACYNGNTPGCIYAPPNLTRCGQYEHFVDTLPDVCSQILSAVHSGELLLEITISPNPTHDIVDVKIPENVGDIAEISVFDQPGRQLQPVITKQNDQVYRIVMSGYPAGIYTVVLNTNNGKVARKLLLE